MRNRPFEGSSGFEVLTPFRLDDGTVFMVDRGWIAQASDGRPSEYAAPPTGHVQVDARLKAGEERIAGRTSTGHRVRDHRPRRARRARRRAELHRRVRGARPDRRRRRRAAARRGPPGARRGPAPLLCAAVVRLRTARVRRARLGREPGAARARGGIRSGARADAAEQRRRAREPTPTPTSRTSARPRRRQSRTLDRRERVLRHERSARLARAHAPELTPAR